MDRETLKLYVATLAVELQMVHDSFTAKELARHLDQWDPVTYEAILRKERERALRRATGQEETLFGRDYYERTIPTLDSILSTLPLTLAGPPVAATREAESTPLRVVNKLWNPLEGMTSEDWESAKRARDEEQPRLPTPVVFPVDD